ncbi:26S proteasome regulatory subunit RPN1 [Mycena sanguinolenta]|nr:26S proteasome regulatory subunit RPN1 [Mycena sanguinolenta]
MTYSDTQPRGIERQPLRLKIPPNTYFQAILNNGVHTKANVAKGLIGEYVDNKSVPPKTSAIMGLDLAYAGSHREDLLQLLISPISDDVSMEIASLATLALGFIFVRSENGEITGTILQTLMEKAERSATGLDEKWAQYMALGLGLLYLSLQGVSDTTIETLKAIEHPISKTAQIIVEACAFAGTGMRWMHYGEPIIRKSVPLAIGLVSVSNPQLPILDALSKYSHNNDLAVALNAIFAMGLVGVGTNNARLAQMLWQLAGYYYKEPDCLFMVWIVQGLVHLGKGMISLNPFYSDRSIMSRPAVAGLLATLTAFTDAKHFMLDKYHWMLYFLVTTMFPSFLITLDEELNNKPVTALNVVGQAGKPRTISWFRTHQTPVPLAMTERAELVTEESIPFSHVLESVVILQKNPGWETEDKMEV